MYRSANETWLTLKIKMETIKEEIDIDVKAEATLRKKDHACPLWEGDIKMKLEKENREIQVPVQIFHKDDAKNGQRLFDWTIGKILLKIAFVLGTNYFVMSVSSTILQ